MTHFRIFISSPGDVPEERKRARLYIDTELDQIGPFQDKIACKAILYDDPNAGVPMQATETPQESVNNARPKPSECDIVIVVLWSRMGTPLVMEGVSYESGTEWEYLDAIQSPKKPTVLVYRCTQPPKPPEFDLANPENAHNQLQEFMEQNKKVDAFFADFKDENGVIYGGVNAYKGVDEFEALLRQHLPKVIAMRLEDEEKNVHVEEKGEPPVTSNTYQPLSPESRARYLKALRNHSLQIPLTVLGDEPDFNKQVRLDQVFINLEVTQKNLDDLQKEDHWTRHGEGEPMLALDAINKHDRVVLLGDPGSGKSSLVKHLVADMAAKDEGLLPVFLVLRDLAPILKQAETAEAGYEEQQAILANVIVEQAKERVRTILHVPEFADGVRDALRDEQAFLVLDGLDEVPFEAREVVRKGVGALLRLYNVPRVIITCRIRSYTGKAVFSGVPTYTLAPLKEDLITAFVDRWYDAQCTLGRVEGAVKEGRIEDLNEVATKEPLLSLARNPMLLTTMTIIHQQETVLPKERVKLYQKAVDLLLKKWQVDMGKLPKDLVAFLESRNEKMRPMMERLAFEAHSPGNEASDLQRMDTINLLADPMYLGKDGLAEQFLDYVDHRSGLLIGRGGTPERPTLYSFPHRTFQEYLAGAYLIGARGAAQRLRELAGEGDFWSEAVLLGIEEQVYNSGSYGQNHVLNLASQLSQKDAVDEQSSRLLLWTSKMAEVVGADVVQQDPGDIEPGAELLTRLRTGLVSLLSGHLPPIERTEAGRTLARIGDPRKEIMTLSSMPFSYVPAGPFLMGEEGTQVEVPYGYWISQHPLTQAQYQKFVDAGGYEDDQWWTEAGWKQLKEVSKRTGPVNYGNPVYMLPNHPVVGVMWYEAYAFTKWLSQYAADLGWIPGGMRIVLPNEPEWEKAARGGLEVPAEVDILRLNRLSSSRELELVSNPLSSRSYPWGNEIKSSYCSYYETEIGSTSTPGCFPIDQSPYCVEGLGGNIWDWSRSKGDAAYEEKGHDEWQDWEDPAGTDDRVFRGGSFVNFNDDVRCAFRGWNFPGVHGNFLGFRVVALPPLD